MKKTKKIVYLMIALLLFTSSVSNAAVYSYRVIRYTPVNTYNNYDNYNYGNVNYGNFWNIISNYYNRSNQVVIPPAEPAPVEPTTPVDPVEPTNPVEQPKPVEPTKPVQPPVQDYAGLSADEAEVVRLVNIEREKAGLAPLKASSQLSNVAREKSKDMATNNYFSHTSPTYGSPFDMMKQFGISYRTAGENIAKGYLSPQSVMNGWMNSSGHKANILNGSFGTIGVGAYKVGNTIYWTQMFTN